MKNDECIKRETALAFMEAQRERIKKQMDEALAYEHYHTRSDLKCALSQLEDDVYLIENIQAANVRPVVRGRWKGDGMNDYRCSLCDHVTFGKPNFCPNCGADMRNNPVEARDECDSDSCPIHFKED